MNIGRFEAKRFKWLLLLGLMLGIVAVSAQLAAGELSYWRSLNPTRDGVLPCPIGPPPPPGPWSPPSECAPFLNDIEFLSPSYGWAVGGTCDHRTGAAAAVACDGVNPNDGLVLYWDGFKWRNVLLPFGTATLTSVSIVNTNDVWAVGLGINPGPLTTAGTIVHWDGTAWQTAATPTGAGPLFSVFMLPGGTDGWAVGQGIGGTPVDNIRWSGTFPVGAWTPGPTAELLAAGAASLRSVHMTSPTFGWIVGDTGGAFQIFKFDGAGWIGQPDTVAVDLLSVYGISVNDAFAVGESSTIIRWNGASWTGPMVAPTTVGSCGVAADCDYRSVWMLSSNEGWIAGTQLTVNSEGLLMRWNGVAWTIQRSLVNTDLNSVMMIAGGAAGGAAGDAETIIYYTGTEWLAKTSPSFTTFNDLWLISTSDGWAVGDFGRIFRWDGRHWYHYETLPSGDNLYGLFCLSTNSCWAVGETPTLGPPFGPTILRWNGVSWTVVTPPGVAVDQRLRDVWCVSANECWAVGTNGTVIKWDGTIWASVPANLPAATDDLLSIQMLSSTDGWAVGCEAEPAPAGACDNPRIIRWNGLAWSQFTPGVGTPVGLAGLRSVFMLNPSNGWAVGDEPAGADNTATILHWDGNQWRRVPGPDVTAAGFLSRVFMVAADNGWAVGYDPTALASVIVHWDGLTWNVISTPPIPPTLSMPLNSLYLIAPLDGWAVGGFGLDEFAAPDEGTDGIILRYGPDIILTATTVTSTVTKTTTVNGTATTTVATTSVTGTVTVTTTTVTTKVTTTTTSTTTTTPSAAIPGFPIESILTGIVGGLIALTIIRRRRAMR